MPNEPAGRIDGRARTVRELLDSAKFHIDFYQREYAWQQQQVHELIDDLTGKFLDFYEDGHPREEVERYGHYFLGSIVISHKRGKRYIVDGQQRLTTLTLLLIHLHRLQAERDQRVDVRNLIFSERFGRKSFNIEVEEREAVMRQLYEGEPAKIEGVSESVENLAARFQDIVDYLPEEVTGRALPFFVDWMLENVHLVEIEAYSDEDAYTIFETMNDRGLSLSLPEMLKGYVLANIRSEADQRKVNATWKRHMQAFNEHSQEEGPNFFKNWLRARHADTIRPGKKGAENRDYERIGSEFHRWVRDHKDDLGLIGSDQFVRLVERDLDFYARQALVIRNAARQVTPGLESIYYNFNRAFTLQTQTLLAALEPDDPPDIVRKKLGLVADYLDIWLARRVWNFRTITYSSVRYTIFTLTKDLRGRSVPELSTFLRGQLDEDDESFAKQPRYRLHHQNYRQVRHVLARLSHWIDCECGLASHFEDLVSEGRARPYEIEHIWPNKYDRFSQWFDHPSVFDTERNRLGGLILLQRGINQSVGDHPFETKREIYVSQGQNLLTRSLHPLAYKNNPAFKALIERTGLPFRAYDHFDPDAQAERQELYLRIAEWVWNPSRLDLDGLKLPEHEPIEPETPPEDNEGDDDEDNDNSAKARRQQRFLGFWTELGARARATGRPHLGTTARRVYWAGIRIHGVTLNYVLVRTAIRVELSLTSSDAAQNKAIFDTLHSQRDAIERELGFPLEWRRLDDKVASRISITLPGAWRDPDQRPAMIDTVLDHMSRLHAAFEPRVKLAR